MKTLGLTARLCVFLFVSLGCGKGEDDLVSPIAGTWKYMSTAAVNCNETWNNYSSDYPCVTDEAQCVMDYFTEHTGRFTREFPNNIKKSGDFRIKNGILTRCFDDSALGCLDPVSFMISGITLTLSRSGDNGCTLTETLQNVNQ